MWISSKTWEKKVQIRNWLKACPVLEQNFYQIKSILTSIRKMGRKVYVERKTCSWLIPYRNFLGLSDRKCRRKPSKLTENRGINATAPYDDPKQHTESPRWWPTPSQPPGTGGEVWIPYKAYRSRLGRLQLFSSLLQNVVT